MDSSRFLFLNLTQTAMLNVLRCMDTIDLVALAMTSRKSAFCVESAKIKLRDPLVVVNSKGIEVHFFLLTGEYCFFLFFSYGKLPTADVYDASQPRYVAIRSPYRPYHLLRTMTGHGVKLWMDYLKYLFHYSRVSRLQFLENAHHLDLYSIKRTFPNFDILTISALLSLERNREILKAFHPVRQLTLQNHVFQERKLPDSVIIQNFDEFTIGRDSALPIVLTLDDVMLFNTKRISISKINFTEKDANRLIKFWIRGVCPRWERIHFCTLSRYAIDKKMMFKGIKYQEAPVHRIHYFKNAFEGFTGTVNGGVDIWNKDGYRATINFVPCDHFVGFNLHVWYPHCVSEKL